MPTQIVMDHTGDTRHTFEVADDAAVKAAEDRFKELTGRGFRAAKLGENGEPLELFETEALAVANRFG